MAADNLVCFNVGINSRKYLCISVQEEDRVGDSHMWLIKIDYFESFHFTFFLSAIYFGSVVSFVLSSTGSKNQ